MHPNSKRVALCATLLGLCAASPLLAAPARADYQAEIRRTAYGIPHILAADWGSLGYGYGYAFAQDNVCVLAREILTASGTQSRWLGASNVTSDWVYKWVNSTARVDAFWEAIGADTRAQLDGYAAGYNQYLADTGAAALPADCRNQPWVQPITGKDAVRVIRKLLVRASTGNFISSLAAAAPPAAGRPAGPSDETPVIDPSELPDFSPERFGSNAVGLGGDLTNGPGALLGNPHFPWYGIERFYAVHMTIPGVYDVMGASIFGSPIVNIGFNRDIAWSHTVSTARRFVLRQLAIVPSAPTSYVVDGQTVAMTPESVSVDVLQGDGSVVLSSHTFWLTKYGPVLVPATGAGWTTSSAYALTDVNLENSRVLDQWRAMGKARNMGEFSAVLRQYVALPWVNTIAADRDGNAFYGDIGAMPNASNAKLAACIKPGVAQALAASRLYALDGSLSACDLGTDADAPEPGIFGAGNMPSLTRRDYVQNSNDSYWLANPAQPLVGYSQIIGTDEGKVQSLRTRLGITQIRDRIAGDGLPGAGLGRQWLQDVLYANRHYSAEIALDDVLKVCRTSSRSIVVGGRSAEVGRACAVLAAWDRRNNTGSVGAHLWTELWRRISGTPTSGSGLPVISTVLYTVPFSAADPVNTPRGVNVANANVFKRVMGELAWTVLYFKDNGIPLDRPWGQIQFDVRNGQVLPIHGGSGTSGVYNAITPGTLVSGVGNTPILGGSSYIQSVTFTADGPEARAVLTYSESSDPANPHYADMTQLFSNYGWVTLPFSEAAIRSDPRLKVLRVRSARR